MADTQKNINYSYTDIEKYLNMKMNATEMHALEKAALTDAFLADAIEGFKEADATVASQHLQQIEAAIKDEQETAKVVTMPFKKNISWRVAAALLALAGIGGITYLMIGKNNTAQTIVKTKIAKPVEQQAAIIKPDTTALPAAAIKPNEAIASAKTLPKNIHSKKEPVITTDKNTTAALTVAAIPKNDTVNSNSKLDDVTVVGYGVMKKKEVTGAMVKIDENKKAATMEADKALAGKLAGVNASAKQKNYLINGIVTDTKGIPIANASVVVNNKKVATSTDANGNFTLSLKDSAAKVSISSIGMEQANAIVSANKNNAISLVASNQSLSEVVVTTLDQKKSKKSISANEAMQQQTKIDTLMPEGGWNNFKIYVKNKLSNDFTADELNGDIEFELVLDKKGHVKDVAITKSPNEKINTPIADAIKQGPKWIDNSGKKRTKKKAMLRL